MVQVISFILLLNVMSEWARRAHHYLNITGRFRGFKNLREGQKYEVVKEGLLEFLEQNSLSREEAEEALEWFLRRRKIHEARALAKIMKLKIRKRK
ncbi:MAG: hypothetical protein J7L91_05260 [Candidatus Korarchaeota archaeon]|nr:hypothetical protein [Candidatus Korarchaeota archaeon]